MITENQVTQLRKSLINKGYCQLNNFLTPQLKEYLQIGAQMLSSEAFTESNTGREVVTTHDLNSQMLYAPPIGENLLIFLTKVYSQISGKNLIPTYSFFRKYYKTNNLLKHVDRPSCQFSATIQIDSSEDTSWPIWVKDHLGNNIRCDTKVGDIVFYLGQEIEHWREELKYEHSSHLFLHWVDGDRPEYKPFWFDGRERLGIKKRLNK